CKLLTALRPIAEPHGVLAAEIAEWSQSAHFDQHGALGLATESHPGLEQNVCPRLPREPALVLRIGPLAEVGLEPGDVGRRQQDHNGRVTKGGVQNVADVWRWLSRLPDGLDPFARPQPERTQKTVHVLPQRIVPTVNDENR